MAPATEAIIDTSRSSDGSSGGRMPGSLLASMDFPAPGGPIINRWWPPAAATSSARRADSWPRISARSGGGIAGLGDAGLGAGENLEAAKMIGDGDEAARREDRHFGAGPRGLRPRRDRADDAARHGVGGDRRRQDARDRRDGAIQRQFAEGDEIGKLVAGDRADRRHQRQRDGEIVVAALLREIGGGEIDDDALRRQRQTGGMERAAHPLAAFADRLVRQADDLEHRLARRDLHLDIDRDGFDALKRDRRDVRDHQVHPRAGG